MVMNEIILKGYPKFSFVPEYASSKFVDIVMDGYETLQVDNRDRLFKKSRNYFLSSDDINMYEVNDFFEGLCSIEVFKMWRPPSELTADECLDWGLCKEDKDPHFLNDIARVLRYYHMSYSHKDRVIHHPLVEVW
jgi:hypothetical protein